MKSQLWKFTRNELAKEFFQNVWADSFADCLNMANQIMLGKLDIITSDTYNYSENEKALAKKLIHEYNEWHNLVI